MRDYERTVAEPWRAFREFATASATTPLHVAHFGRSATFDQLEALAQMFRTNPFLRVGSVGAVTTRMPEEE
jgi:hypothetical protein